METGDSFTILTAKIHGLIYQKNISVVIKSRIYVDLIVSNLIYIYKFIKENIGEHKIPGYYPWRA
jgi:hypothetical protein